MAETLPDNEIRDRDVRNAIRDLLEATKYFDHVSVKGSLPEEYGMAAHELTAAIIQPDADNWQGGWDAQDSGLTNWMATAVVTVIARNGDPQIRDERAEQLVSVVANVVNGKILVSGYNIPGHTRIQRWRWMPPVHPERRIQVIVQWGVFKEGWGVFDVSE